MFLLKINGTTYEIYRRTKQLKNMHKVKLQAKYSKKQALISKCYQNIEFTLPKYFQNGNKQRIIYITPRKK